MPRLLPQVLTVSLSADGGLCATAGDSKAAARARTDADYADYAEYAVLGKLWKTHRRTAARRARMSPRHFACHISRGPDMHALLFLMSYMLSAGSAQFRISHGPVFAMHAYEVA
eukprot:2643260-Pleurochrysis_carterae.AAC.1